MPQPYPLRSRLVALVFAALPFVPLLAQERTPATPNQGTPTPTTQTPKTPTPAIEPSPAAPAPAAKQAEAPAAKEPTAAEREAIALDAAVRQQAFRRTKEGVALDGYDPLSYHEKSGPVLGSKEHAYDHRGIVYWFATKEHREAFAAAPDRYEPPYGGWCAYAVIEGEKVEVDPTNFAIEDGKVLLFYKGFWGDALQKWQRLTAQRTSTKAVAAADEGWQALYATDREAIATARAEQAKARAKAEAKARSKAEEKQKQKETKGR